MPVTAQARRSISSTLAALTVLAGTAACTKHVVHEAPTALGVVKPWRQDVARDRIYVAQIKAIQHIELRAFEKGYLQSIHVDEGAMVKTGQKLFQIMPLLIQAEYEKIKAEYDTAQIELQNTQQLADKKVVSNSELALTKAKFAKAKAGLDIAKAHLNLTTVNAPFDGQIDRFRVRLGSLVEDGELLSTLSDTSKLWVYFNLSERDYLNLMGPGGKAREAADLKLTLANGVTYQYPGKIDTIEADFDTETGNVPLRATFPNPERLLRHGETGNVVMTEEIKNALVIPQKATFDVLDKRYVYVVDDKGAVRQREITVEHEVPHLFVIKSGVSEGDEVLLEGLGKVNPGQVIKAALQTPAAVLSSLQLAAH